MICIPCRNAGNGMAYSIATGRGDQAGDRSTAAELHGQCAGGTWCDCQHVIPEKRTDA